MPDQRIADLAREMMARQLATNPSQFDPKPGLDLGLGPGADVRALPPGLVQMLGGLLDAGTTYQFMRDPRYGESNPAARMLGDSPAAVGGSALAGLAAAVIARKLLARLGHPELADTLAGGLGGYQIGAAANNALTDDSADRTPSQMIGLGRRPR